MNENEIIVVSGLPRSGTSLMMQILQSLNVELFTDQKRTADSSNPKGYFEHELVKTLEHDASWLYEAKGKALKIVSPLLIYLPLNINFKIIFMIRNYDEIIQSQKKMLNEDEKEDSLTKSEMLKKIFDKDIKQAKNWIKKNPDCEALYISYKKLIEHPDSEIKKIAEFLEIHTELKNAISVVDKNLYRTKFE
jgi:hypothetical protein